MHGQRIFLAPGEYWYGQAEQVEIATVLGSCVAVVLWHPASRFLAISHFVLPFKPLREKQTHAPGYYGAQILPFLMQQTALNGIPAATLEVTVVGGAESVAAQALADPYRVGINNANFAQQFFLEQGLSIQQQDVGGALGRKLVVNAATGCVQINSLHCS